ncbi:MAG: flagellin lysine-N-methylase, partial [Eubacteriales bacterium]
MGYIRRPAYYKAFRCIGSDCTENCCIGWEIDVDEDSLAYYETVPGDFGERLRASIAPADEQTGEPAHFRLDAEERCPLLNDCNLCEV